MSESTKTIWFFLAVAAITIIFWNLIFKVALISAFIGLLYGVGKAYWKVLALINPKKRTGDGFFSCLIFLLIMVPSFFGGAIVLGAIDSYVTDSVSRSLDFRDTSRVCGYGKRSKTTGRIRNKIVNGYWRTSKNGNTHWVRSYARS